MRVVGRMAELWRYPVKSMGGECLEAVELTGVGLAGDRLLAFESADRPVGKPLLRSAQRGAMLRAKAVLASDGAVRLTPPATTCNPNGWSMTAGDARVAAALDLPAETPLRLLGSARPFVDVRPVALHSLQSVAALARELGQAVDARRFRSNLILDLAPGVHEDELLGRTIRVGARAELQILEPIPRCRMISLDPVTAIPDHGLLRHIARTRAGRFGLYARPLVPGVLRSGDAVLLLGP